MKPKKVNAQWVWIVDLLGYDVRGGNAEVYSTLERAKASLPHVTNWAEDGMAKGGGGLHQPDDSAADIYVIYKIQVDAGHPWK